MTCFETKSFEKNEYKLVDTLQGPRKNLTFNTDYYCICMIKSNTGSGYHQVGTCKMGPKEDTNAPVKLKLKSYGVERVRVVEAVVISVIPRASTHVVVMLIAEKAADIVEKDCCIGKMKENYCWY